jgi:F-type H+-transporting ATPase subunit a
MASPVLHIKDSYYFEVPKRLWQYENKEQMPEFILRAHPHATLAELKEELDGKIIIPQPPGVELRNLYQKESGFAISRFMVLEVVVAVLLTIIFVRLAQKMRTSVVPKGRGWNLFEAILQYIRKDIAEPAIGHHDADRFVPLLWTMFFFILGCNLFGLIPWAGTPTGAFGTTVALAMVTLATVFAAGMIKFGPFGFWLNQIPHMDLPWYMAIFLKPVIFAIEVVGLFIRHGVLAVRLLANMVAGHLVLLGILGLALVAVGGLTSPKWWLTAIISVVGATLFSILELFVALLQAYVFTFLSALFIGSAVHKH